MHVLKRNLQKSSTAHVYIVLRLPRKVTHEFHLYTVPATKCDILSFRFFIHVMGIHPPRNRLGRVSILLFDMAQRNIENIAKCAKFT